MRPETMRPVGRARTSRILVVAVVLLLGAGACSSTGLPLASSGSSANLVGATDTDLSHWTQLEGDHGLERFVFRLFDDQFTPVQGFPVTMNGCAIRQLRVRWRSTDTEVLSGYTDYLDPGMKVTVLEQRELSMSGTMALNGCEQPIFASPEPSAIQNILIEVRTYAPAVGDIP